MNTKLTLQAVARMMSERRGVPAARCEEFLKQFAAVVSDTLAGGETVRIKDFGLFRLTSVEARQSVDVSTGEPTRIEAHRKVVFVPCKELASQINSPFEIFESVELDDEIDDEALDHLDETVADETLPDSEDESMEGAVNDSESEADDSRCAVEEEEKDDAECVEKSETEDREEAVDADPIPEKPVLPDGPDIPAVPFVDEVSIDGDRVEKTDTHHRFGRGFIVGFATCLVAIALGMGAGMAWLWMNRPEVASQSGVTEREEGVNEKSVTVASGDTIHIATESTVVVESGQVETAPTSPSDVPSETPVYDTITKTRYLTTMAKEHYGDFNLWPYIYEENKAILGHPDRIRPGTRVVIPPLSKFGVTGSSADVAKAKKLGLEIYARYKE